jgi:hypothetical protein
MKFFAIKLKVPDKPIISITLCLSGYELFKLNE